MSKNKDEPQIAKLRNWIRFLNVIATLSSLSGIYFFLDGLFCFHGSTKNEVGDYIGGTAGALWGLAGVALVAVAFFSQQIQIEYQKIEISVAREDSRKQYFENTFFNLLNLHHRIISNIDVGSGNTPITGTDCFKSFLSDYRSLYNNSNTPDERDRIKETSQQFFKQKSGDLNHYISNIKAIINFVDSSFYIDPPDLSPTELEIQKAQYFEMVKAQISVYEKIICAYYGVLDEGFMNLYDKLKVKDDIDKTELIKESHKDIVFR